MGKWKYLISASSVIKNDIWFLLPFVTAMTRCVHVHLFSCFFRFQWLTSSLVKFPIDWDFEREKVKERKSHGAPSSTIHWNLKHEWSTRRGHQWMVILLIYFSFLNWISEKHDVTVWDILSILFCLITFIFWRCSCSCCYDCTHGIFDFLCCNFCWSHGDMGDMFVDPYLSENWCMIIN